MSDLHITDSVLNESIESLKTVRDALDGIDTSLRSARDACGNNDLETAIDSTGAAWTDSREVARESAATLATQVRDAKDSFKATDTTLARVRQ